MMSRDDQDGSDEPGVAGGGFRRKVSGFTQLGVDKAKQVTGTATDHLSDENKAKLVETGGKTKRALGESVETAKRTTGQGIDYLADKTSWKAYRTAVESTLDTAFEVIAAQQAEIEQLTIRIAQLEQRTR